MVYVYALVRLVDLFNAGPPFARLRRSLQQRSDLKPPEGGQGGWGDWGSAAKPLTLRPIRLPMDPEMAVKMMAYKERQDAKLQRCANKIRWFLDLLLWLLKYNLSRIVDRTERQVGGQSVDNAAGK